MAGPNALAENVPLTPALLRLDPMFDPLRNHSRFQNSGKRNQGELTQLFRRAETAQRTKDPVKAEHNV
ncbi:MAG: hypothetical protein DME45_06615 [Verrucomicrobia bacterium]|nr:MAG: hypothetical protein DME45_06615 [Verrucomicrobiota bacterium]